MILTFQWVKGIIILLLGDVAVGERVIYLEIVDSDVGASVDIFIHD